MPRVKQSLRTKVLKKESTKKKTASLRATAKQFVKKIATKPAAPRNDRKAATRGSFSVPVYSLTGRLSGTLSLPKEIFGGEVNKKLLAQALRVYTANTKIQPGHTKTRGEVEGSTAKIYRQKGTGRARHGAIRAPIFVGGGIIFGPKYRKVRLDLPSKMKKSALLSAFSVKLADKKIIGVSGMEKASGKTKEVAALLGKIAGKDTLKSALIVTGEKQDNVSRAVRNIPRVSTLPANLINVYEVIKHDMLMLTKDAIERLKK